MRLRMRVSATSASTHVPHASRDVVRPVAPALASAACWPHCIGTPSHSQAGTVCRLGPSLAGCLKLTLSPPTTQHKGGTPHVRVLAPSITMSSLVLTTALGKIRLQLLPEVAPLTVAHITELARRGIYDGASFYRSDFVIQCGLHVTSIRNPLPALSVNESGPVSNERGTAAVAHWDVPDCGNSEWFINLQDSPHLDKAYGGYCVFARVAADDAASWATVSAIAKAVPGGSKPAITKCEVV
jgi:cyclophilin family peptidyl-prolyl cis-trans isomerase